MTICYVKNSCFVSDSPDCSLLSTEAQKNSEPHKRESDLAVVDAQTFILETLPLPNKERFGIFRLFENRGVILLDFKDNRSIADALGRPSAFVAKYGRQAIPPKQDAPLFLGEGYDFRLADIAEFYNRVGKNSTTMTKGERNLLERLIKEDLVAKDEKGFYYPTQEVSLLGMSRFYDTEKRREIFKHEYYHALYFLDPSFQKAVSKVWESLDQATQRFLKSALVASGYYASGEKWLIETEAESYAMANPFGRDGFASVFAHAWENCKRVVSSHCNGFLSFNGDITNLLQRVHDRFAVISTCRTPFPEDCQTTTRGWIEGILVFQEQLEVKSFLNFLQDKLDTLNKKEVR